jgi:hypothetical protein
MHRRTWTMGALLSLAIVPSAATGVASGNGASRSLIAIHEHGTERRTVQNVPNLGEFTIELDKTPFGPGGTTAVYALPPGITYVNGQQRVAVTGSDTLTSKTGRIELRFNGTHIDLNSKLLPSGDLVGPAAEYGTWKITSATGIYQGWKGGGDWAAVLYGYGKVEPYSVEWDGYISR